MNQMVSTEIERSATLASRHEKLMTRLVGMSAIINDRSKEKVSILSDLSYSQKYLDSKDEVLKILGELQEKTQRKTKVFFENLLTRLVHEVLPHEKGKRVVFDLKLKNNSPQLDICVDKGNGKLEDIYDDNGGAITNVVSMGLRFIVLSRTKNRRFLMFDEAEAWIKPVNVPAFVKVLYQMSKKLGVQVVFITHHKLELFEGAARVIELTRDENDNVLSEVVYDPKNDLPEADSEEALETLQSYIRFVRLRGFKSHTNTLLKLSPNLTVITGDNNLGKSHMGRALKGLREAQTLERNINHDATHCRVEIGLEADTVLAWEYHRSGKHKTRYYVEKKGANEPLESSTEGGKVPVWLHDYLFMENADGFDLHVDNQKQSVFMMGADVTSTKRAELLSMGRENNYIQQMLKRHNDLIKEHQGNRREKQKRLKFIETDLSYIRETGPLAERLEAMKPLIERITNGRSRSAKLKRSIKELASLELNISLNEESIYVLQSLKAIKPLKAISDLGNSINRLAFIENSLAALKGLPDSNPLTEIKPLVNLAGIRQRAVNLNSMNSLLKAYSSLPESVYTFEDKGAINRMKAHREASDSLEGMQKVISVFDQLPKAINDIPAVKQLDGLKKRCLSMIESQTALKKNNLEQEKTQEDIVAGDADMKELIEQLGDTCPICQQTINHSH